MTVSNPLAGRSLDDFLNSLRKQGETEVPKNSLEVYQRVMRGLVEEDSRLSEIADAMDGSAQLDKRAGVASRRMQVLGKMADVEKGKAEMLRASLDVDTVVYAVFMVVQEALRDSWQTLDLLPEIRDRLLIQFLTAFKEKASGLRGKVEDKVLEVRDVLPKIEHKVHE
jgi:hypothetical protein